jgi:hypothetical protein
MAGLGAFFVHAHDAVGTGAREPSVRGVPLLVLAAAGRRGFRPIAVGVSVVAALNLNLFYGFGDGIGYALPRAITIIDPTVIAARQRFLLRHAAPGNAPANAPLHARPACSGLPRLPHSAGAEQSPPAPTSTNEEGDRAKNGPESRDQRRADVISPSVTSRANNAECGIATRSSTGGSTIQPAPPVQAASCPPAATVGEPADLPMPSKMKKIPTAIRRMARPVPWRSMATTCCRALERADDDHRLLRRTRVVARIHRFAHARDGLHAVAGVQAWRVDHVAVPWAIGKARRLDQVALGHDQPAVDRRQILG